MASADDIVYFHLKISSLVYLHWYTYIQTTPIMPRTLAKIAQQKGMIAQQMNTYL